MLSTGQETCQMTSDAWYNNKKHSKRWSIICNIIVNLATFKTMVDQMCHHCQSSKCDARSNLTCNNHSLYWLKLYIHSTLHTL